MRSQLLMSLLCLGFLPALGAEPAEKPKPEAKRELVSIVFLLKAPRTIDLDQVRPAFRAATGKDFSSSTDADNFVAPFRPPSMYGVLVAGRKFGLISSDRPYVRDAKKAAAVVQDIRVKEALLNHKGWISIDSFDELPDEAARHRAYATIGLLLSSIAGEDCLAVYSPETNRLIPYDETVRKRLAAGEALEALRPRDPPIIAVPEEDPAMKAAVARARQTFGEFGKAFAAKKEGQHFSAKASFGIGKEMEFMWVTVTSIDAKARTLQGTLDNRPARLKTVKVGDAVQIGVDELNDWLVIENGKVTAGGYTVKVIEERMKAKE